MRKRIIVLYAALCLCFFALMIKIISINLNTSSLTVESQQTKTITLYSSRAEIYDRNLSNITSREEKLVAAITPVNALLSIPSLQDSIEDLEDKIKKGLPFSAEISEEVNSEFVKTFKIPIRYSDTFACHITGYTGGENSNGICGIEKAYNDFLVQNSKKLSVTFEVDAYGRALAGLDKYINDNGFSSKAGVVLTIDNKIQQICEDALKNSKIESGCAVVMHIDTGEIYALASVPVFDRNDISKSLNESNSPLLNKALQSYSIGSVFKPIIAACALEQGISEETTFSCSGSIKIGDTVFKCYNEKEHGKQNMTKALENSCNTYFINLLNEMDIDLLLNCLKKMGFSSKIKLCDNLYTEESQLPLKSQLTLAGERANFAFGQGKLLSTPIHILSAYHTLATGYSVKPTIIYGFTNEDALLKLVKKEDGVKIFSNSTTQKIQKMLSAVVENGNATNAKSDILSLAGKTGTAQSGVYKNQSEILRTWFAGFFPYNNPHYIVVVFNENGTGGNYDCAEVFKKICEETALSQ